MALAAWIGFQFIATLYLQQLRGWSSLETGLAIFPAGALVALALAAQLLNCSSTPPSSISNQKDPS